MADEEAVEARRRKLRLLEQSLFGGEGDSAVALPQVKDVGEYTSSQEAGTVTLQEPHRQEKSWLQPLTAFYKEPKKKVRSLAPAPSSPGTSASTPSEPGSKVSVREWSLPPSAPPLPFRPKTATASALLEEELRQLAGVEGREEEREEGREEGRSSLRRQGAVDRRQYSAALSPVGERPGRRLEVREKSVRWDRATLVVGEGGQESSGKLGGGGGNRAGGRTELLLSKEQEELDLSSAKFQLLRNATLERVKQQEHGVEEQEEGARVRRVQEHRQEEQQEVALVRRLQEQGSRMSTAAASRTFVDMPAVYEKMPANVFSEMPTDTFSDIPTDVFEDIPRAVTARIRNRERLKTPLKESEDLFEEEQEVTADYTASAPFEQISASPEHVGFIAMLFSGPSLGREDNTGELEQDFMFALFIQKQEEAALMSGRPGEGGGAGRDPTVGHFCAPFCPGFCEANLCIFHTSG